MERRREVPDAPPYLEEQHHRLAWPVRLAPGMWLVAAVAVLVLAPFSARTVIVPAILVVVSTLHLWLNAREQLTISPRGIAVQHWLSRSEVAWDQIATCHYTEDTDAVFDRRVVTGWDVALLLPKLVATLFILPMRALLRRTIHGARDRRFYVGRLELRDAHATPILTVAAKDHFVDVEAAFDRILDELARRQRT